MPVLFTPQTDVPGEPTDPGSSTGARIQAIWTPPSGDSIVLTACPDGIDWLAGRGGEDLPPFSFTEDDNVDFDGNTIRGVKAEPRTLTIPLLLHVQGQFAQWRPMHQRFARALNPLTGDGVMTYVMPDGTSRQLFCRYSKGAEGDAIRDPANLWWRVYALQFRAVDPWWYSTTPEVIGWDVPGADDFFPLLPVKLASSRVIGNTTLDLAGDVPTYGVWTITGPVNGVASLSNVSVGRTVTLNLTGAYQLNAGERVMVDMRPGQRTIIGPGGQNWFPARSGLPKFFSVNPGVNRLAMSVAGATEATTVQFAYQPKWLTA